MAPIPKGGTVAVTGAAGFIGGWVVRRLLEGGYRVRACVRNTEDDTRVGFLRALPGYASKRLTLHAADLDNAGCFDDVFRGCHGVAHLSHVSNYNDQHDIRRVCAHIIASVNAAESVTRVVVTSSTAAVISEVDLQELVRRPVCYEDRFPDETNERRTPERGQGYSMGKVLSERQFAAAATESGRWDAITCCPADNVGPIQSAHQSVRGGWQQQIEMMLRGSYRQTGAYRPWMTVDVRDVADAHIGLLASTNVRNGERYIAWSTEKRNVEDICTSIGRLLPELRHQATPPLDDFPERVKVREPEMRGIWAGCDLRNERIRALLGMEFRPLDVSIRDCVESLLALKDVPLLQLPD